MSQPTPSDSATLRQRLSLSAAGALLGACLLSACATTGGGTNPSGGASTPAGSGTTATPAPAPVPQVRWPVKTASFYDLWLHSFGVLTVDTTAIPLFKRGYRDSVSAGKTRRNILTSLDANRETLQKRMNANPALVQAQFLVFEFRSFDELQRATASFLQFEGQPNRAPDQATASAVARLAGVFPTAPDREWLRLFMAGVTDEQSRFYEAEYARSVNARAGVMSAVDSVWQKVYRAKFERFLNNTSQRNGEIYLSLPLGGEGRASTGASNQTVVAVPYPTRPADALQAIFVLAHEVTGNLVGPVINDNVTPAQQRDGQAGHLVALGQVHAGMLLLQKVAPELVEPYAKYYLVQGGKSVPANNAAEALRVAFPVSPAIITALTRQIEIVLGGI